MKVRVQFGAQLRAAVGRSALDVELAEGSTVEALIEEIAARMEAAAPHLLNPQGDRHRSLLIVVNNSALSAAQVAATALRTGDSVMLLPAIAGG